MIDSNEIVPVGASASEPVLRKSHRNNNNNNHQLKYRSGRSGGQVLSKSNSAEVEVSG